MGSETATGAQRPSSSYFLKKGKNSTTAIVGGRQGTLNNSTEEKGGGKKVILQPWPERMPIAVTKASDITYLTEIAMSVPHLLSCRRYKWIPEPEQ